ncbi:helix-turn-helix domain-containing protein [Rhodanobacter sp. T12-5]|uniref:helix-turn-helix domain-containing protein n=1 Tax=Rhodanobacter sp. T12-5 TaxID=2024611 RepID=UPI0011EEAEC8|nr:helix-turn-helix domain-containing protein [Rhodanobacter sp. T12-5]KAA0068423.1 nucleotidyltransferase domain-containing protein [Rhodanobacter sp. T12-5]
MKPLIHHLLGETRTAILAALLLHPDKPRHVRELVRATGASPGTLHRELNTLVDYGVLQREQIGRQVFYRADVTCSVLGELTGLMRKTAGMIDILRDALLPLADKAIGAFVYGSMASGDTHVHSDVDVMVVGTLSFADAVLALQPAQEALRREVNPTVLSLEEFRQRRKQPDSFVARVWKEPKLWLIGEPDELGKPGQDTPDQTARHASG